MRGPIRDATGQPVAFEIDQEAWDAFRLFDRTARTQWRLSPMGEAIGLDYTGLETVARMMGLAMDEATLDQVQVLEAGVLTEWQKQRELRQMQDDAKRAAGAGG